MIQTNISMFYLRNRFNIIRIDNFKNKLRSFLEHLNDDQGFKLPQEDEFTSYDNPEYLWLAYELEHIRHAYNSAMVNPYTGELLAGCKKIPYVQLR